MQLHERIPNNVNLHDNRRLLRALERWQPNYIKWWNDAGPSDFKADEIYLRTAISVDSKGWANFDYVKMHDYKWGIFLALPEHDRRVPCGDDAATEGTQNLLNETRVLSADRVLAFGRFCFWWVARAGLEGVCDVLSSFKSRSARGTHGLANPRNPS